MKYFLHSTDSFDDEKITELFLQYGYEGLGLFYVLLEKIGKQEKPVKTSVLKAQLKVGKRLEKCWSFMESLGIISSSNGETFNERILSYSETYQIKKQKTKEKVAQWRENQAFEKNVTSYVPVSNPPKVKESKVKESKEDIVFPFSPDFNSHWERWKRYKKELKFTYKSTETEQAAINELRKKANDSEATAIEMINQSIANGWKGFFELKKPVLKIEPNSLDAKRSTWAALQK